MTRRLVALMVGLVVTTLVIAGLGTLVLANVRARADTAADLRQQAFNTAANLALFFDESTSDQPEGDQLEGDPLTDEELEQRLRNLTLLRRVVDLDGFAVFAVDAAGTYDAEQLPDGIEARQLDVDALRAGRAVSGNDGDLVFAAAPLALPGERTGVIVLVQQANAGLGPAARYFALAAIASALLGVFAAIIVGRRVTQPIRAASAAATRIADGELNTRLPTPSKHAGDEIVELSRHVNEMAESLGRSRALEQQFLLSVSHDLRTPLTSIRGYAEAISDGAGDPARAASVISSEARRLERLVADLLDLAKLQASSFSLRLEPVDLARLATVAVDAFEPDAAERGLLIRAIGDGNSLPVLADHDRLGQVAGNLIENAMKYASTGVVVRTSSDGTRASMTVSDDGPGIDPADLPHLFERLYVARRRPARHENSSGLGLAIVKQLVEAMHGDVSVASELGTGTTFTARLPLERGASPPGP